MAINRIEQWRKVFKGKRCKEPRAVCTPADPFANPFFSELLLRRWVPDPWADPFRDPFFGDGSRFFTVGFATVGGRTRGQTRSVTRFSAKVCMRTRSQTRFFTVGFATVRGRTRGQTCSVTRFSGMFVCDGV